MTRRPRVRLWLDNSELLDAARLLEAAAKAVTAEGRPGYLDSARAFRRIAAAALDAEAELAALQADSRCRARKKAKR